MKFVLFKSALVCAILVAPSIAYADDDSDTILVVGQRDRPIEIEPRGLAVSLGDEQFKTVNAFNVEDLIKYAPNFFVRKRFAGDSNGVPGFRGTHSTQSARTLVMVDGFVVSNFLGNSFGFAPKWGVVGPGEVKQFDIVYGPYSSRYVGNSIGGIINITTRDPEKTEGFATVQGFAQPYKQFSTDDTFYGYSGEAGVGFKQKDGPFSVRLTGRYFRNRSQPQSFLGLTSATGTAPGIAITGAIIDPKQAIPNSPGLASNPIFAAEAHNNITQSQGKLKIGYNNGEVEAQALFAYWNNLDNADAPESYIRDANGNPVFEGRVTTLGRTFNAAGANFRRTRRGEYLAGFKVKAPVGPFETRINLSTFQIAKQSQITSNGYIAGLNRGAGTLARQGQTGWYTGDLTVEYNRGNNQLAFGVNSNLYETSQTRFNVTNFRTAANPAFTSQTFGKTRQVGLFIEDEFKVSDSFSITAGIRYDDWRAFDGGLGRVATNGAPVFNRYVSRKEDAVSPTLSAQVDLDDRTTAQLSLATATRFPTVGELFQGSLNGDGSFNVNSFDPNLKPERSRDLNLLIAHDAGKVKLTGSFFYQRVKNTIFSFQGFNQNNIVTSSFKNIDLTSQFGFELIVEARDALIPGLDIDANFAYIDSQTLRNPALRASEGVQFPRIPRVRINGNIRYAVTPKVDTSLGLRYASRPNTDLSGTQRGDTFGYTSELFALDARVNWSLPRGLRLSAGVDNLTNSKDFVFHPYPQRTFLIEAGVKF
jgi:iron complex outermembrane recepter protein